MQKRSKLLTPVPRPGLFLDSFWGEVNPLKFKPVAPRMLMLHGKQSIGY